MEALDAYYWPQPDPVEVNAQLGQLAKQLYENSDYALVGSAVIGGGIFEQPARVMGLQNFLMALISEPAFADRLMETITDIYISLAIAIWIMSVRTFRSLLTGTMWLGKTVG